MAPRGSDVAPPGAQGQAAGKRIAADGSPVAPRAPRGLRGSVGRGRGWGKGCFDIPHLDIPGTRGNGECTMRRGRLGRRSGGEMVGLETLEERATPGPRLRSPLAYLAARAQYSKNALGIQRSGSWSTGGAFRSSRSGSVVPPFGNSRRRWPGVPIRAASRGTSWPVGRDALRPAACWVEEGAWPRRLVTRTDRTGGLDWRKTPTGR